jgi:hypothetical protein
MIWRKKPEPKREVVFSIGKRDGHAILNACRITREVDVIPRVGEIVRGIHHEGYGTFMHGTVMWVTHDYQFNYVEVAVGYD